jgi:hypothetical protein
MIIETFQPEHVQHIDVQAEQSLAKQHLTNDHYLQVLAMHESWTGFIHGKIVGCAGFIEVWPGRHQAWALISATIGPEGMVQFTKAVKRGLALKSGRVELVVASEFKAGHRWARLLGFTLETPEPMRRWFPEGGDASLYARIS